MANNDDVLLQELFTQVRTRLPQMQQDKLTDVKIFMSPTNCTYTENKERIFIRTRNCDGKMFGECELVYVIVHEMSHVMCPDWGHTASFWKLFKETLQFVKPYQRICVPPLDYNPCVV